MKETTVKTYGALIQQFAGSINNQYIQVEGTSERNAWYAVKAELENRGQGDWIIRGVWEVHAEDATPEWVVEADRELHGEIQ